MIVLHPLYDPQAKVFVVTVKGEEIEAKSISNLLAKLGPAYSVRDYYPHGMPAELTPKSDGPLQRRPVVASGPPKWVRHPPRKPASEPKALAPTKVASTVARTPGGRLSRSRASKGLPGHVAIRPQRDATPEERAVCSERNNEILDAWAAGETAPALAKRFGMSPSAIGANIIPKARLSGDPRAVVRNTKTHGSRRA